MIGLCQSYHEGYIHNTMFINKLIAFAVLLGANPNVNLTKSIFQKGEIVKAKEFI